MKLQSTDISVESRGIVQSTNFNIETSAKAFIILSNSLYSNKIKAVVRELSTNASDSHFENGNPERPFDVHLPTGTEPFFYVRDYGISLTHEDCMSLYQTYFKSTKTETNDLNGCLGLGSKSPFAYSDSFMVQAYLNGTVRTYAAYVGDKGVPSFDLLSEDKTDQENGLCVQVPVKLSDIDRFHTEAFNVYRFFDVKPNVFGGFLSFAEPIIKEEKYELYDTEKENYIVMGQIGYPIDVRQCGPEVATALDRYSGFTGIVIKVQLGLLDITPSRESLSYNKTTINNIKIALNEVIGDIEKHVQNEIDKEPTLYKARLKVMSLMDCGVTAILKDIKWGGVEVFKNVYACTFSLGTSSCEIHQYNMYGASLRERELSSTLNDYFTLKESKFLYDDDNGKFIHSKIKKYLQTNRGIRYVFYCKSDDIKDFIAILGDLEESEILKLSELPKPQKVYNNTGGGITCYKFDSNKNCFIESKMSVKYQDATFFAECKRRILFNNRNYDFFSFEKLIKGFNNAGFNCENLFLVKPGIINSSKLSERKNWSNGNTKIIKYCEDLLKKLKIDKSKTIYDSTLNIYDQWFDNNEFINDLIANQKKNRDIILNIKNKIIKNSNESVYDFISSSILNFAEKDLMYDYNDYIRENYPILNTLNYFSKKHLELAKIYISAMDELRELKREKELCNT